MLQLLLVVAAAPRCCRERVYVEMCWRAGYVDRWASQLAELGRRALRATESLEISAEHTPVGDPADELVVLVDDGDALGIGARKCLDGVLERIRGGEAWHGVGEGRSACRAVGPVAER
jgi:hypothetical protein